MAAVTAQASPRVIARSGALVVRLALLLAVLLVAAVVISGQPVRWARCMVEARDGWTIEYPRASVTEREFRQSVREQTPCVGVTVRYVHTGDVSDGRVLRPVGGREWVAAGGNVEVLIEHEDGDGVVACGEPIRPQSGGATEVLACSADLMVPPSRP